MGFYEHECWLTDTWGANRSERQSGVYHPFVPDLLCDQEILLHAEAVEAVASAQAGLAVLDAAAVHVRNAEPLARLLLRSEAVASSRIEGLTIGAGKLLEYEALEELGVKHRLDGTEAAVLANIDAMRRGVELVSPERPCTVEDVCSINRMLLEHGDLAEYGGCLRDRQNWIGGNNVNPLGAAYVPPRPEYVPALMDDLVRFINGSKLPPVAVAAIAHAQLETIHPFVDGNGRTGRTLVHMVLRRAGLAKRVVPPVSLILATDKERYIGNLAAYRFDEDDESASRLRCINDWVEYFARSVRESVERADAFEMEMRGLERLWRDRVAVRSGSAADLLLGKLVDNPVVSIESAKRLTGRSYEAVRQAVSQLVQASVLVQNARNRKSNLFVATEVIAVFTSYERALSVPGGDTLREKPVRVVPQKMAIEESVRMLDRARRNRPRADD